jgi:hypothetical protein
MQGRTLKESDIKSFVLRLKGDERDSAHSSLLVGVIYYAIGRKSDGDYLLAYHPVIFDAVLEKRITGSEYMKIIRSIYEQDRNILRISESPSNLNHWINVDDAPPSEMKEAFGNAVLWHRKYQNKLSSLFSN